MSCDLYINNQDDTICYNATGVLFVSLDKIRNCFRFSTSDISSGNLDSSILDNTNADITYYLDISNAPIINPAHSMMNSVFSQNAVIENLPSCFLKEDMLRYIGLSLFSTVHLTGLISNKREVINEVERKGWTQRNNLYNIFLASHNNGEGLTNTDTTNNITRNIMKQIYYYQPERFDVSENGIQDTVEIQDVPFIEGDTINFFFTLYTPENQEAVVNKTEKINERKYRILLYITNNTNYENDIPSYSLADEPNSGVDNRGLP